MNGCDLTILDLYNAHILDSFVRYESFSSDFVYSLLTATFKPTLSPYSNLMFLQEKMTNYPIGTFCEYLGHIIK